MYIEFCTWSKFAKQVKFVFFFLWKKIKNVPFHIWHNVLFYILHFAFNWMYWHLFYLTYLVYRSLLFLGLGKSLFLIVDMSLCSSFMILYEVEVQGLQDLRTVCAFSHRRCSQEGRLLVWSVILYASIYLSEISHNLLLGRDHGLVVTGLGLNCLGKCMY